MLPVARDPPHDIINSSLCQLPKLFELGIIKPLFKKPQLDPNELANSTHFKSSKSKMLGEKVCLLYFSYAPSY